MHRATRALAAVAFTLVSCSSPVTPASTPTRDSISLHLYATSATIPLLQDLTNRYAQNHPEIVFSPIIGTQANLLEQIRTSGEGYLLTNHLPRGNTAQPLLAWPIGQDGIAVITDPTNPVKELTSEQVRRIFLGHIANWQDVGGADLPITVLSREDGSGTRAEFEEKLIGERLTTRAAVIIPNSAAMIASTAQTAGSIGYVSMSYLDGSVTPLAIDGILPSPATVSRNEYPLRTTLFVVGTSEPDGAYRDFIAWVQSAEGQSVVSQHYGVLSP